MLGKKTFFWRVFKLAFSLWFFLLIIAKFFTFSFLEALAFLLPEFVPKEKKNGRILYYCICFLYQIIYSHLWSFDLPFGNSWWRIPILRKLSESYFGRLFINWTCGMVLWDLYFLTPTIFFVIWSWKTDVIFCAENPGLSIQVYTAKISYNISLCLGYQCHPMSPYVCRIKALRWAKL